MDREQKEIQFLGFFGILRESYNVVSSWRKLFAKITLLLIVPLSSVYLAQIQISEILFNNIMHNEFILRWTPENSRIHQKVSDMLTSEWTSFVLFKIGYFVFFLVLSLLSTAAVVYTVACIYTAKQITLRKVMSVVPKVWKRLILTFIWSFIIVFAYIIISILVLVLGVLGAFTLGTINIVRVFLFAFSIVCLVGLLYITVIWQLAGVVSVLEESYGLKAMAKSRNLIKGKTGVSAAVFLLFALLFGGIQHVFKILVVFGGGKGVGNRIGYGIVCLILLSITLLFGLIAHTVVYFVCKSYHHENIDKSSLADHLGGYLGEYVPLKSKGVQLEQFEV